MDNFVKPYFIGLSSPLPFLLIMIGVIGIVGTFLPLELGLRAFRRLEP